MSTSFKTVRFHETGGPEVLRIETAELRTPGVGEVAIKVKSLGMAQGDAMYREGTYLEQPDLPSGLGTEACGEIVEVGANAGDWKVGDRISVHSSHSKNRYPLYGEYAVLPISSIVAAPKGLNDIEAGAFSLSYIPMYLALVREAHLKVGDVVLLNAAGANTSLAAANIARMAGAKVIGLVRSQRKADMLKGQAFDHVFVTDDTIVDQVRDVSNGGVNIVLDPVLGPDSEKLSDMCRMRGRIIHYGALQGPIAQHSIYNLAPKFLTVSGFTIYGYSGSQVMGIPRNEAAINEAMRFIEAGVDSGALKIRIAKEYALDDIVRAHQDMKAGDQVGKIVVTP